MEADPMVELRALPLPIAQIVKGALEAEGIEAEVQRNLLGSVYGIDAGPLSTRLLVRMSDVTRAETLLAEIEAESDDGL